MLHNRFITDSLKQILRSQVASNVILQDLKQRMSRIEDAIKSRAPVLKNNDSLIAEIIPLQTVENIKDFELLLRETEEAVTQFVSLYICHFTKIITDKTGRK